MNEVTKCDLKREDIIRMAKEAGLNQILPTNTGANVWIDDGFYVEELESFAALVAAAEREKVAKENAELLQALQNLHQRCHWADAPEEMDAAKVAIEKAIRARGGV